MFASISLAASNVWAPGFPKRQKNGDILVKGTATADKGSTLGKTGTAIVWPAGHKGGVVTSFPVTVDPTTGNWTGTLTGLQRNVNYEIVVQVSQTASTPGATPQTIATQPKTRGHGDDD
jgi:hypothetical protein